MLRMVALCVDIGESGGVKNSRDLVSGVVACDKALVAYITSRSTLIGWNTSFVHGLWRKGEGSLSLSERMEEWVIPIVFVPVLDVTEVVVNLGRWNVAVKLFDVWVQVEVDGAAESV